MPQSNHPTPWDAPPGPEQGRGQKQRGPGTKRPERPKRDTRHSDTLSGQGAATAQQAAREAAARAPAPPPGPQGQEEKKGQGGSRAARKRQGQATRAPTLQPQKRPTHLAAAQTEHQGGYGCQHNTPTPSHTEHSGTQTGQGQGHTSRGLALTLLTRAAKAEAATNPTTTQQDKVAQRGRPKPAEAEH